MPRVGGVDSDRDLLRAATASGAQLVRSLPRRDQVWFVERDGEQQNPGRGPALR